MSTNSRPNSGRGEARFASVQILRAVAALSVVLYHIGGLTSKLIGPVEANPFAAGYMGVDLFFVISGFIISYSTDNDFDIKSFVLKRLARIVPIYWFLTFGVMLIALLAPSLLQRTTADYVGFISSLLFIPHAMPDGLVVPTLAVGWTINYEMFFYVVFSFCLIFKELRAEVAIASLLTISLMGALYDGGNVSLTFWSSSIILEFAFGCVVFLFYKRIKSFIVRLVVILFISSIIAALAYIFNLHTSRVIHAGLPAACLLSAALGWVPKPAWLVRLFVVLGDASYSMYLVHMYIVQFVVLIIGPRIAFGLTTKLITIYTLSIVMVIVVSILLYRMLERPMNKFLQRAVLSGEQK